MSFKILKFNCCGLDVHKTWIYACVGITDSINRTEYKQARFSLRFYRKYPQRKRETNRPIVDPFWEIKPITKKEYLAGIWDELPFKRLRLNFRCKLNHPYVFFLSRAYRRIGQAQM